MEQVLEIIAIILSLFTGGGVGTIAMWLNKKNKNIKEQNDNLQKENENIKSELKTINKEIGQYYKSWGFIKIINKIIK